MWKKVIPPGSRVSFPGVVDDIQDFVAENTNTRLETFIQQYGVLVEEKNGVILGDNFKLTYAGATTVNIAAGRAMVASGLDMMVTADQGPVTVNNLSNVGANSTYNLVARYYTSEITPVDITDGFHYDTTAGNSANTGRQPQFALHAISTVSGVQSNELLLATGTTNGSSQLDSGAFNDARIALRLNSNVFNDSDIVKTDRDVTIDGIVTLTSGLISEGAATIHGHLVVSGTNHDIHQHGSGSNFRNFDGKVEMADLTVYDDDGITKDVYTTDVSGSKLITFAQRTILGGGLQALSGGDIPIYNDASTFIGNVLLSGDTPTETDNLRVFNIDPDKYSSSNSIVTFKWNYDDLLLSGVAAGSTLMKSNPSSAFKRDTATIGSDTRWQTIISGTLNNKYLYFPGTQNQYKILSHTNATEEGMWIYLTSGLTAEDAATTNVTFGQQLPSRVIDNADSYLLTVERQPGTLIEASLLAAGISQFKETVFLSEEAVRNPYHTMTLPTDTVYNVELIARKRFEVSPTIRLNEEYNTANRYYYKDQAFDAVGATADQTTLEPTGTGTNRYYFRNVLPDLGSGAVTATGTKHGMELSITGWLDETNPNNNAHEYEIIYKKGDAPTSGNGWEDIKGTSMDSSYTRTVTKSRHINIGLAEQSKISVAVWPLQNGQRVASAATAAATGGAGGVMPEGRVIADTKFNLSTYEITLYEDNVVNAISGIMSPAISGVDIRGITPEQLMGSVIQRPDDSNSEFYVDYAYWRNAEHTMIDVEVTRVAGTSGIETTVSGICKVNTTEAGRRLMYAAGLPIDYQLTGASLNINSGRGLSSSVPGIVRVYQEGLAASSADFINVTAANTTQNPTLDETIQGERGGTSYTKTLIVDAYDNTGVNNHCNISGEISVYARPLFISSTPPTTLP